MPTQKKREYIFGMLMVGSDLIFLGLAFFIAYRIRFMDPAEIFAPYKIFYFYYSLGCILLIILILFLRKLYNYKNLYRGMGEAQGIILGVLVGIFLLIIFNYYLQKDLFQLSRVWLFYSAILSLVFLIVSRAIVRRLILWLYRKAGVSINTLIIGINEESYRIAHTFNKKGHENIRIIGFVDKESNIKMAEKHSRYADIKILGSIENFEEILSKYDINRLVISSSDIKYFDILLLLDKLKNQNIEIQLSPSLFEFSVSRMKIFEYMGIPLIQIQEITIRGIDKFFKYIIDYSIGLILFLIFLLIYPVVGLLIKFDSSGPVLFTQDRYGKDFEKIRIYKFRTMRTGADKEKEILERLYDRDSGGDFKLKDDPRITRVGKFLRKTSLDELPQIINVLKGELSVIGPRALAIPEGDKLKDWERKRMEIKQGITGLWQVSGRSDVNYEERMRLDLYYIQNWSIALELRIIVLTVLRMFFNRGAY
jgi:exopolysaccharide biosynthesis polyprenyl glycosylphosphotransferase